ncbi:probable inactive leucine-rich repeat receptor kinase XIAO [Andrographis paniculata]|uniref:probable inactive leucine-rich repeat receptor kinase XIAO n=1 Tax=Andrographis paniculata TaxID=175694 RepID=UPI0021E76AAB|nr:probable inactive leucine-rich repeat receptor kinase XIAO [Andrographis paniculata]
MAWERHQTVPPLTHPSPPSGPTTPSPPSIILTYLQLPVSLSSPHSHFPMAPLLLLLLLLFAGAASASAATHPQDLQALRQLKSAIDPSSIPAGSCIDSWDFSVDPCDSIFSAKFTCGFRCNFSRVTDLALDAAGYSAALSAAAWTFPYLQNLDLSNNNFSGPIPAAFSALTNLQRLVLSHNSLTGAIPAAAVAALPNLQELILDSNYLSGPLPPSLNLLRNLQRLELQNNRLGGALPDLSRLAALNFLDASDNSFSGEIPAALPPSLVELALRNNQLSGSIPASVAAVSSLEVLDLSHNSLAGEIPAALFSHPSLEQLTVSYNQFGSIQQPGPYPDPTLTSQLISVDLSNNQIRGFLPGFMGQLPRLSALSLENNKFSGPIPTQYVLKVVDPGVDPALGLAQFERLLLGGNYLFGPIPGAFLELKAGSVTVRLGDNCLYRCPLRWFFCEGGVQKSLTECRAFGPIIP